jgi:hypothetical protein
LLFSVSVLVVYKSRLVCLYRQTATHSLSNLHSFFQVGRCISTCLMSKQATRRYSTCLLTLPSLPFTRSSTDTQTARQARMHERYTNRKDENTPRGVANAGTTCYLPGLVSQYPLGLAGDATDMARMGSWDGWHCCRTVSRLEGLMFSLGSIDVSSSQDMGKSDG